MARRQTGQPFGACAQQARIVERGPDESLPSTPSRAAEQLRSFATRFGVDEANRHLRLLR